ncbi:MAG: epoxyqueuosine reductase QueH [Clostridium sp.]
MEKIFLHTCCAPCSIYPIKLLKENNLEPVCFWYNINIHPYTEYMKRKQTLEEYTKQIGIELIIEDDYGLMEFLKLIQSDYLNRCKNVCYLKRLERTAQVAKERGFKKFSTTLLVSPYQDTEALIKIGKELARKYDLEFIALDFKAGFREGQREARRLGLYMQKYCGCIFSEAERYNRFKIQNQDFKEFIQKHE